MLVYYAHKMNIFCYSNSL